MYLTEYFLGENVFIDFACDPYYGSGQEYVNYPIRFGSVEFGLVASEALVQIVDRIRVDRGYRPGTQSFTAPMICGSVPSAARPLRRSQTASNTARTAGRKSPADRQPSA